VEQRVAGVATCTGLSPLGRQQSARLRDRWADNDELGKVTALYSSTMARARETADIIAPALGSLPVVEDGHLCEQHPGDADGIRFEEYVARYGRPRWEASPYEIVFPGGETLGQFHVRVGAALQRLARQPDGETIVIACHGGVVDVAMRSLLNLPMLGGFELQTLNTSITEFEHRQATEHTPARWRLLRYNDAGHLAGLPAATPRP